MKRLVLVKTCREIQTAHLYEHLFLASAVKLFKERNLFNYIDYRWSGRTYHGGFIYLYIILISPEAKALALKVNGLSIELSEKSVAGAICEINAEERKKIGGNHQLLMKALEELHDTPWQSLDNFDYLDTLKTRRSRKVLWSSDLAAHTKVLESEVILESSFGLRNRKLLPLYNVLATALLDNISSHLREEVHAYMYGDSSVHNNKITKEVTKFRVWIDQTIDLETEIKKCDALVKDMLKKDFVKRLSIFLIDHQTQEQLIVPDELKLYEKYQILIGQTGWKEISTEANVSKILEHTTLKLTFNGASQESKLIQ